MLQPDEIFLFDEDGDPAELLRALPRIAIAPARRDKEPGLPSRVDWKDPIPPARPHHAA